LIFGERAGRPFRLGVSQTIGFTSSNYLTVDARKVLHTGSGGSIATRWSGTKATDERSNNLLLLAFSFLIGELYRALFIIPSERYWQVLDAVAFISPSEHFIQQPAVKNLLMEHFYKLCEKLGRRATLLYLKSRMPSSEVLKILFSAKHGTARLSDLRMALGLTKRRIFARIDRRSPIKEKRRPVSRLELHVSHTCNLACDSCSHYSNHAHRGSLDLAEADRWMRAWRDRINVREFNLLGGEPTMHPRLPEFVELVRKHWPHTHIRIITNGFFLHRHPELPTTLARAGNSDLALSVHHGGSAYLDRLRPIFDLLEDWQRNHGTIVHTWPSHHGWTRRYHGFGATMLPFEDDKPRQSWEICPARDCKQLHEGKLWKCAPLAYLGLQKGKYNLSGKWDRYLQYKPLDVSCTDSELDDFLALEDESFCSMCPGELRPLPLEDPLRSRSSTTRPVTVFVGD
jgi:hypothetical protein